MKALRTFLLSLGSSLDFLCDSNMIYHVDAPELATFEYLWGFYYDVIGYQNSKEVYIGFIATNNCILGCTTYKDKDHDIPTTQENTSSPGEHLSDVQFKFHVWPRDRP
jgi:hypothetical protein